MKMEDCPVSVRHFTKADNLSYKSVEDIIEFDQTWDNRLDPEFYFDSITGEVFLRN